MSHAKTKDEEALDLLRSFVEGQVSLRDRFAMAALVGMGNFGWDADLKIYAERAYAVADAMLKVRNT